MLHLQLTFGLDFETPRQRSAWRHNSLLRELKRLVDAGILERLHDAFHGTTQEGHWRWIKDGAQTLDELIALAQRQNVGMAAASTEPDQAADDELELDDLPR